MSVGKRQGAPPDRYDEGGQPIYDDSLGIYGRRCGETFRRFTQCLKWAKEGKTFIYYHPDFVAIDMKSWEAIDKILHPPAKIITPYDYYDEFDDITPEKEQILLDYFNKRLKKPNNTNRGK